MASNFSFQPIFLVFVSGVGQYDGVGFVLALLSFLSIFGSLSILGPGLLTLAILIKPTSLILLPIFFYMYIRKKRPILYWIFPILIFWITTQPFTHKKPIRIRQI